MSSPRPRGFSPGSQPPLTVQRHLCDRRGGEFTWAVVVNEEGNGCLSVDVSPAAS